MYAGFQLGNLQQLFRQTLRAFDAQMACWLASNTSAMDTPGRPRRSQRTDNAGQWRSALCAMVSEMCLALCIKSSILSSIALTSRLSRVNSSSPVDAEMRLEKLAGANLLRRLPDMADAARKLF